VKCGNGISHFAMATFQNYNAKNWHTPALSLAERARFELAEPVKALRFSRPVHSTALSPLQNYLDKIASKVEFGKADFV
jgi:hypothetical protein